MANYEVSVREASIELSARDRIRVKDTTGATPLDSATQAGDVTITPAWWAILDIHNEGSNDKDYSCYVIVDRNGERYKTGSQSFWSAFLNIWNELKDDDEPFSVRAYRMPSKNREGRDFITCSLI